MSGDEDLAVSLGLAYALFYVFEKLVLQRGMQVCFRLLDAENGEKYCVATLFGRVGLMVQASQNEADIYEIVVPQPIKFGRQAYTVVFDV